jgi:hypothetical protein
VVPASGQRNSQKAIGAKTKKINVCTSPYEQQHQICILTLRLQRPFPEIQAIVLIFSLLRLLPQTREHSVFPGALLFPDPLVAALSEQPLGAFLRETFLEVSPWLVVLSFRLVLVVEVGCHWWSRGTFWHLFCFTCVSVIS